MNNKLCVCQLNVRSIFTGFNELNLLLHQYEIDVLAVTETWLSENIRDNVITIPNYVFYRKDRLSRGGGVGFFIHDSLNSKKLSVDADRLEDDFEFLWISVTVNRLNMALGVYYRAPNRDLRSCINNLDNNLPILLTSYDQVIVLGDFNVNLLQNKVSYLSKCLEFYGFTQIVKEPTRISTQTTTLLDPIYVFNSDRVCSCTTIDANSISDHRLVLCTLEIHTKVNKSRFVTYRDFKNFVQDDFLIDLFSVPWNTVYDLNNIDSKVDFLTNEMISIFDKHAPKLTKKVTKPFNPWLTDNLKLIFQERDRAWRIYRKNKTVTNLQYYKEMRNFALAATRAEKQGYLSFIHSQKNSKQFWNAMRNMNIKLSANNNLPSNFSSPKEINDYFVSVYNCNHVPHDLISFYKSHKFRDNVTFAFKYVDQSEVLAAIEQLKSNASGSDGITLQMVKLSLPAIIDPLTHLFNNCFENGYFPLSWREATVCPVPKVPNVHNLTDLRPISLLPVFSKIFEKLVSFQIKDFCKTFSIIPKHQSGFRSGHSTNTSLLNLTDDIIRSIDKKYATILLSLDFSKAFDTISHSLMCSKLEFYGFNATATRLFSNYLSFRRQRVSVNGSYSDSSFIVSGVPQGSILGPLLFTIYTADMFNMVEYSHIQSYADDTQILFHFNSSSPDYVNVELNRDLRAISSSCLRHNLKLNAEKTVALLFCQEKKRSFLEQNISISLNNQPLTFSSHCKILGVTIDTRLRFEEHVKNISQKCYVKLRMLYANQSIINFKIRKKLIESFVLPILSYCITVYYPCLDVTTQSRLKSIQNSAVRYICKLRKFDHISHSILNLKWLNIEMTTKYLFLSFLKKLITSHLPAYLYEKLVWRSEVHNLNIRNRNKITMPLHSTALFQRSFSYNAVMLYNKYSAKIAFLPINQITFKKRLKHLLLDEQFG